MPIQFDNYNAEKLEHLKMHLQHCAQRGQTKPYEIFVDTLKAVPKTEAIEDFYSFESYLNTDSERIKVIIYNSAQSPRNEQFVFVMKAASRDEAKELGLHGITSERFTKRSLGLWQQRSTEQALYKNEVQALKAEISRLKGVEREQAELIESYEKIIEKAKQNGNKIGGVHIGEVLSVAMEGLVRRNTHLLSKLPFGEELAGIIEKDNFDKANGLQQQQPEISENSFSRIDANTPTSKQEISAFNELFLTLEKHFSEEEMQSIMHLLSALMEDPNLLPEFLKLIQLNNSDE